MSPTSLIGTVGHKWIANDATQGFAASVGRCAGISSSEATTTHPIPQPTEKPLPGQILRSPPAHADLVLGQPHAPPPHRERQGWLRRRRRASPDPIGALTLFLFLGSIFLPANGPLIARMKILFHPVRSRVCEAKCRSLSQHSSLN